MRAWGRWLVGLGMLAGQGWVQAQQQAPDARAGGLRAEVLTFRVTGEQAPPEPRQSFVLGETAVYVTRVSGFGLPDSGDPVLEASYTVVTPDGKSHEIPADIDASQAQQGGGGSLILMPALSLPFRPERSPSGVYYVDVVVRDIVARTEVKARAPLFLFLSEDARAQVEQPSPDAPTALDETLFSSGLWDLTPVDIGATLWPIGLSWTSLDRAAIRAVAGRATFLELPVVDVLFRLQEENPAEVRIFFYNRGDQGIVTPEWFENTRDTVTRELTRRAGRQPENLTPRTGGRAGQDQEILGWQFDGALWRLDHASSNLRRPGERGRTFQPEYISLTILPEAQRTRTEMAGRQRAAATLLSLRQAVVRAPNGDVYLDIPMHDQGEKEYCAPAAAERVFDYLGASISQHEIAQIMLVGTGGGTSFEDMLRGFRDLARRFGLQVRVLIHGDSRAFSRLVEEYNRMARRLRRPLLDLNQPVDSEYGPKSIWEMFDRDIFLQSRIRSPAQVSRFLEMVQQKIDGGIPLVQACVIGILPEEVALGQDPGGHARLIVGYNAEKQEILYSDSWGAGHERKRMPVDHGYAITIGLLTVEPPR